MTRKPTGLVLAFDTTGNLGSVAVLDPAAPEREVVETFTPSRRHAARLLPAIRSALRRHGAALADDEADGTDPGLGGAGLALLAATRGPGSFTGLRVGLATLGGLAFALDRPAAGVSSLEAAALADFLRDRAPRRRLALVDALRGEVFAAGFGSSSDHPAHPAGRPLGPPRVIRPEAVGRLAHELQANCICGPGAVRYREQIAAGVGGAWIVSDPAPLAPATARLAIGLRAADPEALPRTLAPLYLRDPDIHGQPVASSPASPGSRLETPIPARAPTSRTRRP